MSNVGLLAASRPTEVLSHDDATKSLSQLQLESKLGEGHGGAQEGAHNAIGAGAANAANVANLVSALQVKATIPDYVLLLTVSMGSAFIGALFPEQVADVIKRNRWAQHVTALALLVMTIVWVRADTSLSDIAFATAITYAWYLALLTATPAEFLIVIALLFVVFASSHVRVSQAKSTTLARALTPASASAIQAQSPPQDAPQPPSWQLWVECGALTAAAALTALFASRHVLDALWA
jgi:hypothetical protein